MVSFLADAGTRALDRLVRLAADDSALIERGSEAAGVRREGRSELLDDEILISASSVDHDSESTQVVNRGQAVSALPVQFLQNRPRVLDAVSGDDISAPSDVLRG